jgi:hypothetical protein
MLRRTPAGVWGVNASHSQTVKPLESFKQLEPLEQFNGSNV